MFLDDSGARLDALFNSRLERGVGEEGGTKTLSTRSLCQVGRSIVENSPTSAKLPDYLLLAPRSPEVEVPSCYLLSQRQWVAGGWEVTVHMMPSAGKSPESPGPGEDCRRLQGWTPLLRTQHSERLGSPGSSAGRAASCCARVIS